MLSSYTQSWQGSKLGPRQIPRPLPPQVGSSQPQRRHSRLVVARLVEPFADPPPFAPMLASTLPSPNGPATMRETVSCLIVPSAL
jgi:hypothetical protein